MTDLLLERERVAQVEDLGQARKRFENLRAEFALRQVQLHRRKGGGFVAQRGALLVDLADLREAAELLQRLAARS